MKFSLTISSENVTKSAENCRFGQIYLRNNGKLHFLCSAIKDFFSKCDQIRRKLRIWSRLLRKYLMGIFFFCVLCVLSEPVTRFPSYLSIPYALNYSFYISTAFTSNIFLWFCPYFCWYQHKQFQESLFHHWFYWSDK